MRPRVLLESALAGTLILILWLVHGRLGIVPVFLSAILLWWPNRDRALGRATGLILLLLLASWILHQAKWVVYPLVMGILLAYLILPLVERLQRVRLSRSNATLAALVPVVGITALVLVLFVPAVIGRLGDLISRLPDLYALIMERIKPLMGRIQGGSGSWPWGGGSDQVPAEVMDSWRAGFADSLRAGLADSLRTGLADSIRAGLTDSLRAAADSLRVLHGQGSAPTGSLGAALESAAALERSSGALDTLGRAGAALDSLGLAGRPEVPDSTGLGGPAGALVESLRAVLHSAGAVAESLRAPGANGAAGASEAPAWLQQLTSQSTGLLKTAAGGLTQVGRTLGVALQWIGVFVLTPVITYYLVVDWHRIDQGLRDWIPLRWQSAGGRFNAELQKSMRVYVRGQLLVAGIESVLFSVIFLIAGLEDSITIGVLAGVFSLIPYLGFILTIVLVVLSALTGPDAVSVLWKAGVGLAVLNVLEGQIIVPRVQGSGLGLHPLFVLLGVLLGGTFFGLPGIVLAVPILGVTKALLPELRRAWKNSGFYTGSGTDDGNGGTDPDASHGATGRRAASPALSPPRDQGARPPTPPSPPAPSPPPEP